MVKRVVVVATAVVVLGSLGFIIWLNPSAVDFQFAREQTLHLPLGWLLIFTFLAGIVIAAAGVWLQQLARLLTGWRQRRRARVGTLIANWERNGLALAWDGEVDRSRGLLLKAWKRSPAHSGAALALASSYMDTNEVGKARQILAESMARDAADPDVRFALSEALRRSGEIGEAIRILETVRVQHPRAPRALTALRELYRQAGRWQEAAQVQEAYLNAVPTGEHTAEERARLIDLHYQAAMRLEDLAARIEALNAVLQNDWTYVPAIVSLGEALLASGHEAEALKLWERTLRTTPCLLLAERLYAQQKTPRDRQRLLASLRRLPEIGRDTVHALAARSALDEGNVDVAAGELEMISDVDQPAVSRLWAEVHRQRGAFREALRALTQLADSDPARRDGFVCRLCGRVPNVKSGGALNCKYWDGVRSLG